MGNTMNTDELGDRIGRLADRVDNLIAALEIPFPDKTHVAGVKGALPNISADLKALHIELTGENPWEGQPA